MSRTDANTEKTAGTLENVARPDNLHWDVFVTPGIPIVTRDKPPGVRDTFFQATASTLIYGVRDAVLVDAFMTVKQANALADWVAGTRQEPDNHLHYTWSWGPLVWSRHAPRAISTCESSRHAQRCEGDATECLARSSRGGLEGGIPRTNS